MNKNLQRVLKQVKLTQSDWDDLIKDFEEGETKLLIRAKYNLNNFQYKYLKKYLYGEIE